ncbi:MAG: hypothetical protein P8X47_11520, partial [Ignavibacteriaceae bacterium]
MYKQIKIERTELYEKIWSKPMTEIAKEYEVSDKAIAKICYKLKIPVPGLGYWRKVETGIKVVKTPLPDIPPDSPTIHYISKQEPDYQLIIPENIQQIINTEKDPKNKIIVPEKRGNTHPLLPKTETALKPSYRRNKFLESREAEGIFSISVSSNELRRAFRILNTLIKELEKRKYLVYLRNFSLCVKMYGAELKFGIKEGSKRIELPHEPKSYFREYDFVPTGKLILSINDLHSDYPLRKNFTDNRTGILEDKLNDFIIALIIAAHSELAKEKHWKEERRKSEEKENKRKEMLKRIKQEETKIEELNQNVELWHKSELIRNYVREFKKNCLIDSLDESKKKEVIDYCNWALLQADRVDPFKAHPYSIVDDKEK